MRAGDIFEKREECDEATAGVAEVWSELLEFSDAIARSMVGEFASLDDGVATTGEFGTLHWQHIPSPSESRCNEGCNDNPLPIASKVIDELALVRRFFATVKGSGLSCSDSSHNVEKCVLSRAVRSFKQKERGVFRAKVRQFHQ